MALTDAATYQFPGNSLNDQVRWYLGDTDVTAALVSDTEIIFALSQKNGDPKSAAAFCARFISIKIAREPESVRLLDFAASRGGGSTKALADRYYALALELEQESPGARSGIYAGGISVCDKLANEQNTDTVQPAFRVGMHDHDGRLAMMISAASIKAQVAYLMNETRYDPAGRPGRSSARAGGTRSRPRLRPMRRAGSRRSAASRSTSRCAVTVRSPTPAIFDPDLELEPQYLVTDSRGREFTVTEVIEPSIAGHVPEGDHVPAAVAPMKLMVSCPSLTGQVSCLHKTAVTL